MVTWDEVIIHEVRVLVTHTMFQSLMALLILFMIEEKGSRESFLLEIIIVIGFTTVERDLKIYHTEGPSSSNNMVRSTVNLGAALLSKFLLSLLCSGKTQSEAVFDMSCGLNWTEKLMLLILYNLRILAIIRTSITGIVFIYQLLESLWDKIMGRNS